MRCMPTRYMPMRYAYEMYNLRDRLRDAARGARLPGSMVYEIMHASDK